MKSGKRMKICLLCLLCAMCICGPGFLRGRSLCVMSVQASEKKNGLKKEKGKYYFYRNGKKQKNIWKTIKKGNKKYRYYFGKNGAAYAGKVKNSRMVPSVRSIKGAKYAFDQKGRMLKGIYAVNMKFYCFASNGKLDPKKTGLLRKASVYEADGSVLRTLLEQCGLKPEKVQDFGFSCHGAGTDITYTYANFSFIVYQEPSGKQLFQQLYA